MIIKKEFAHHAELNDFTMLYL